MLKMHAMGHEALALQGAKQLLAQDPPDIIHMQFSPMLIQSSGQSGAAMLKELYEHGYKCFDCSAFRPPSVTPESRSVDDFEKQGENALVCLNAAAKVSSS